MSGQITNLYSQSMQSRNTDMQAKETFHGFSLDERQKAPAFADASACVI